MKHLSLFLLLILWSFVGCESTIIDGTDDGVMIENAESATSFVNEIKKVPFKGTYAGPLGPDFTRTDCPMGTLPVSGTASGKASHMGKIDVVFSLCSFSLLEPTNPNYVDGRLEMIAANGDQVFGEFYGAAIGPDTFVDYVTITGGTGQFEYASGEFTEYGTAIFTADGPALNIDFAGMISSVGSNK